MPHLHRLHPDDEGVGEDAQQEQRGGRAPDGRLALREMNRVDDNRGGVEDEWKQIQRTVGA